MKKILVQLSFLLTIFSTTITSCKKGGDDQAGQGPDATYINNGVLCTVGTFVNSTIDTLAFSTVAFIVGRPMGGYAPGSHKPEDELTFISDGNGTVRIKLKIPYTNAFGRVSNYLAIKPDSSAFPVNPYYLTLAPEGHNVSELQFVIKRNANDGRKFTIESKKYPGNLLNIAKHPGSPVSTKSQLVFTSGKQEFFFMPK